MQPKLFLALFFLIFSSHIWAQNVSIGLYTGAAFCTSKWQGNKEYKKQVLKSSLLYGFDADININAESRVGISFKRKELFWGLGNKLYKSNLANGLSVSNSFIIGGFNMLWFPGIYYKREIQKTKNTNFIIELDLNTLIIPNSGIYDTSSTNKFWREVRRGNRFGFIEISNKFYQGIKPFVGFQLGIDRRIYKNLFIKTSLFYEQGFLKIAEVEYGIIDEQTVYPMKSTIRGSSYGIVLGFKYMFEKSN